MLPTKAHATDAGFDLCCTSREVVMKFEATFSEHGRVMTRTYDKPDATKEDVIEWFGLRESDIDWFRIKQINEDD